jgi:transposase
VPAAGFVATVDAGTRFRDTQPGAAYLGLIPSEWSSSETPRRGHLTKAGNGRLRWLLVQAAWGILRRRQSLETAALRDWAERLAGRRGRALAAVALAHRLAGILLALWRVSGRPILSHRGRAS